MAFYNVTTPRTFQVQEHIDVPIFLPGMIMPYAGSTGPYGWLLCEGQAISRTIYSDLFNVIGTTYGSGNGFSTFNVPDLRGNVIVGLNMGIAPFDNLGNNGGEINHTLNISELPSHNHNGTTDNAGAHNHIINDPGHAHTQTTVNDDFNNSAVGGSGGYPNFSYPSYPRYDSSGVVTWTSTINSSFTGITNSGVGDHQHTFTTNLTGGGDPHNNLQPYLTLNYMIKF